MKRPNVLLMYTDQQRWDTIAAGGNSLVHTPNLDALAARGALFNNAYCNTPVCMPSRQSMLSGLYPATLGTRCNGKEMPEDVTCIHNILKLYDYHTANLGKLHFKNHSSYNRHHEDPHPSYGFDTLVLSDEPGCYDDAYIKWVEMHDPAMVEKCRCMTPPAWTGRPIEAHPRGTEDPYVFEGPEELTHTAFVADETISYLRRHQDEPFFCISGFYAPHAPINPPERFVQMYDQAEMPLPARNEGENLRDVSDAQWRKIKAYYYALCSHIDDQVGRILNELRALGLEENTIVIFTSDHGELLGDHGLVAKGHSYDGCTRVPLIVSYPKAFAPQPIHKEIIEAVDLVPTILDCCGVQVPSFMQGRSFRNLLEGRDYKERKSAFIEHRCEYGRGGVKAIRTNEWLYSYAGDGSEKLFDLENDPDQLTNVAADPAYATALSNARREMVDRWFDVDNRDTERIADY